MLGQFRWRRRRVETPAHEPKFVLARRGDGLGERLNALLNAMRLAEILDVEFRFTWAHGLGKDPSHAIVRAEEFFSSDFVAAHKVELAATRGGFETLAGRSNDLASLRDQLAAAERGLLAPGRPLHRSVDAEAVPAVARGFSAEFGAVGFHPRIAAAMAAARGVTLADDAVGIHLRAGDNLFGRFRSLTTYWYKVVPVPVARALIERFRAEGREVLVFGQDAQLIGDLCATTGGIDASTVRPPGLDRAETAMFDLVLLSQCSRIISGWSGFAIQAASVGDKTVENHLDLIAPHEAVAITREDIARHGHTYDATHRAFAWWAAYYAARHDLTGDDALTLVENALEADPTNPRYRLRLAALHYHHGRIDRGNAALVDALLADAVEGGETLESVILFSVRMEHGYDSKEIVDDIDRGAHDGSGPAHVYRAALRARGGDAAGAQRDLEAFRAFVAREPLLSDLDDGMVEATITHRLRQAEQPG